MSKFKFLPIFAGAAALGALALGSSTAHADAISGQLTVANANLATQGSGPYASYTITGEGTGTTFNEFEVTTTGLNSFVFGDHNIFALNLSSAAGTGTLCTATTTLCTTGAPTITLTQASGGQVDGFGSFNFVLDDGNGFSSPHTGFTFDFTTSNPVTAADLLTANGSGVEVAGHLALSTNTSCTGFAGNAGTSTGGVDNGACQAAPAPVIGHGLLVLLAIGGILSGGKLLENVKKGQLRTA